jgi:hypothetical protein
MECSLQSRQYGSWTLIVVVVSHTLIQLSEAGKGGGEGTQRSAKKQQLNHIPTGLVHGRFSYSMACNT